MPDSSYRHTAIPHLNIFRFNNYWARIPRFLDCVKSAWLSVTDSKPCGTSQLCLCLKRTRADLKVWQRSLQRPTAVLQNCSLIIEMMDLLEECRPLSHAEFTLRTLVRSAAQEHATQLSLYWRQRGKINECKLGDANTKFFHLSATIKWRKNQIGALTAEDDGLVTSHDGKAAILHDFYKVLLGTPASSSPAPPNLHELLSTSSLNSQQA